ncbi:MAG: sulfotransferase family 2 domain-containing protein [Opitutales bacterium]
MTAPFDDNTLLLFTHIPKCAGSSFRDSLIVPNVAPELIFMPKGGLRAIATSRLDFQYLVGHWPYGIHHAFHGQNPVRQRRRIYITILRQPIEQMLSLYYYRRRLEEKKQETGRFSGTEDATAFYQRERGARNMQCKQLAGLPWWCEKSPLRALVDYVPALALYLAQRNLERHYHFVLQLERSQDQFPTLAQILEIRYEPTITEATVTRDRPKGKSIREDQREKLARWNRYDQRLYDSSTTLPTCRSLNSNPA